MVSLQQIPWLSNPVFGSVRSPQLWKKLCQIGMISKNNIFWEHTTDLSGED